MAFLAAQSFSAAHNGGHWVFALDDSYIHLAMARTLAAHGTWGIEPGIFAAASSAPLYTLLLAAAFLTGWVSTFWAWLFAAAGGVVVAWLLTDRLQTYFPRPGIAIGLGLAAAVIIWLPELIATGMEPTLHIVAILCVAMCLERVLGNSSGSRRAGLQLVAAIGVAAALRFETLFFVPPIVWFLWRTGRRQLAAMAGLAGILPALVLGLVQVSNGAMFLPNSVLLKGVDLEQGLSGHMSRLLHVLAEPSQFALLLAAALSLFESARREKKAADTRRWTILMFIFVLCAHAALARPDRRYLGYVLALGIWALAPVFGEWWRRAASFVRQAHEHPRPALSNLSLLFLVVVIWLPFADHFIDLGRLPRLGTDIYAQQFQMARFFNANYGGETVALNDIGAAAWMGGVHVLDLRGLANDDVARLRLHQGSLSPDQLQELARQAGVAVVAIYSHWFLREQGLPDSWQLVGRWQIPAEIQVNCASNTVDFLALSTGGVDRLNRTLHDFNSELPASVTLHQ
jgi:hypothetical protein